MDALHRMGITRWHVRVSAGNGIATKNAHEDDADLTFTISDSGTFDATPESELERFSLMTEDRELSFADNASHWSISDINVFSEKDSTKKASAGTPAEPLLNQATSKEHSSNTLARPTESDKTSSASVEIINTKSVLSMRGRLLNGKSTNDIFVVACSEGRNKDVLIDLHQESGRLLNSMLKSALPAPHFAMPSVLMLGADNGDKTTIGKLMLLLGERAAKTVLGPDVKPPFRGKVHLVSGVRAVCTYHPEELRQNATLKPMAWDDLRLFASLWPNPSDDGLNLNT